MKNTVKMNAKDLFKEVVQERLWHGQKDKKLQQKAGRDKELALLNKLSYEKSVEWLEFLGYKKLQEETWEAPIKNAH